MQTTNKPTEGWTFIIDKLEIKSTGGMVHGWFMYYKLETLSTSNGASRENLITHYLTPFNSPAVIKIPRFLFTNEANADTVVDLEIGPKEIYAGLVKLFSLGYSSIPTPQLEIPLHTIPPSKREALIRQVRPWSDKE